MTEGAPASRDDWDSHWEHYAESAVRNPAQLMRHDFIARLLCESAGTGSEMRILDIGSGQGDLLRKLNRLLPRASLLGVEVSRKGVAISREKVPQATFVVADLFRPQPQLEPYLGWATHAVCSEVLEHVDDPTLFLKATRKYLFVGGKLIVTIPAGPVSAFDRHIGHRQHFDRTGLEVMLRRAGFSTARTYATGFPFFNFYRLLVVAGGKWLVRDVKAESRGVIAIAAGKLMKLFGTLFRANMQDFRFGWQLIAVAHKLQP